MLLDTTPLVGFFLNRGGATRQIEHLRDRAPLFTSMLCYGEAVEYLHGRKEPAESVNNLRQILESIQPLGLSLRVMERYADLRRQMRSKRLGLIGDVDTLIAATAIEHGFSVVTTDRDFLRVPGLDILLLTPRTFDIADGSR